MPRPSVSAVTLKMPSPRQSRPWPWRCPHPISVDHDPENALTYSVSAVTLKMPSPHQCRPWPLQCRPWPWGCPHLLCVGRDHEDALTSSVLAVTLKMPSPPRVGRDPEDDLTSSVSAVTLKMPSVLVPCRRRTSSDRAVCTHGSRRCGYLKIMIIIDARSTIYLGSLV